MSSGSFPGIPTTSTSKTIVESAGTRGLPAEEGRPFLPKAKSDYICISWMAVFRFIVKNQIDCWYEGTKKREGNKPCVSLNIKNLERHFLFE